VILLTVAGWQGGTLVHRNQIGVDHRYAGAGKWQEETASAGGLIQLKDIEKLGINQMKLLHAGDKRIVIGRTESSLVAFDDHCTHRGGTLADGALICGTVQCPWHGSQFDVVSGEVKAGPAREPIKTYHFIFRDETYFLEL
jgi:nitrite reductase/ring-hydroxylating ferredoxin subunit